MIRIKVSNQDKAFDWTGGGVEFSTSVPLRDADGLLCWMTPTEEFYQFDGPKGWYAQEALGHSRFKRIPLWSRGRVISNEFFHFSNKDDRYRVPHITSYDDFTTCYRSDTLNDAVAVINNHGGRWGWRHAGIRLRNRMVCENPRVHLYGQPEWWASYRKWFGLGPRRPPRNYKGAPGGKWYACSAHREFLARFKVNICLENTSDTCFLTMRCGRS